MYIYYIFSFPKMCCSSLLCWPKEKLLFFCFWFLSHAITDLSEVAAQQTGLCSYERYTNLCKTPRAELDANKTDFFLLSALSKAVLIRSLEKNMLHLRVTTSKRPYSKQNNFFI